MIAASYRATESNPRTIEAIKRQQERERQRRLISEFGDVPASSVISAVAALEKTPEPVEEIDSEEQKRDAHERLESTPARYTMRQAIQDFALVNGVSYRDLVGPSRSRKLTDLRHLAYWEVHKRFPDRPTTEIGRAFGGRDHTTILHGLMKHGYTGAGKGTRPLPRMIEPKIIASMRAAGKTYQQIGEHFGVSEKTIRKQFHAFEAAQKAA